MNLCTQEYGGTICNKTANEHILDFAVEEEGLDYLKGHLCGELKLLMSKITRSNLEKKKSRGETNSGRKQINEGRWRTKLHTAQKSFKSITGGYKRSGDLKMAFMKS